MYFGPTQATPTASSAPGRSGSGKPNDIDNPRDMFDMLDERERPIFDAMRAQRPRRAARRTRGGSPPSSGAREFFRTRRTPSSSKMYSGRRADRHRPGPARRSRRRGATTSGQLGLLLSRYFKVKVRDVERHRDHAPPGADHRRPAGASSSAGRRSRSRPGASARSRSSRRTRGQAAGADAAQARCSRRPTTPAAIFFLVVAAVWFGTSQRRARDRRASGPSTCASAW